MDEQIIEMTGGRHSPRDYRTVNIEHLTGAAPIAPAATAFHIDDSKLPDFFQRKIGACQNHAFAEIYTHRKQRLEPGTSFVASPRFGYTLSKMEDGIGQRDQGTYTVQPFKEGVKYGVCSQATLPNDTTLSFADYTFGGVLAHVPQACFTEADQNRIPGYVQVGAWDSVSPQQLLHALQTPDGADGIAIMLPLGLEWFTSAAGKTSWAAADIIPIRKVESLIDDHVVRATGIEQEAGTGRWKVFFRNHWSLDWGNADTGWFYADQHVIAEAWMVCAIPDPILALVRSLPNQKDFNHTWAADLDIGAKGEDVQALQVALKIAGTFPFLQPTTTYYGPMTAAAVQSFQRKFKVADEATIVAAGGKLGPMTRNAINKMFSHK